MTHDPLNVGDLLARADALAVRASTDADLVEARGLLAQLAALVRAANAPTYVLFAGYVTHPDSELGDYHGEFHTLEAAQRAANDGLYRPDHMWAAVLEVGGQLPRRGWVRDVDGVGWTLNHYDARRDVWREAAVSEVGGPAAVLPPKPLQTKPGVLSGGLVAEGEACAGCGLRNAPRGTPYCGAPLSMRGYSQDYLKGDREDCPNRTRRSSGRSA